MSSPEGLRQGCPLGFLVSGPPPGWCVLSRDISHHRLSHRLNDSHSSIPPCSASTSIRKKEDVMCAVPECNFWSLRLKQPGSLPLQVVGTIRGRLQIHLPGQSGMRHYTCLHPGWFGAQDSHWMLSPTRIHGITPHQYRPPCPVRPSLAARPDGLGIQE